MANEPQESGAIVLARSPWPYVRRWLLQNVALLPLLAGAVYIAYTLADARYDDRYASKTEQALILQRLEQGRDDRAQLHNTDTQVTSDLSHLKQDVQDVKASTNRIEDKIDRIIMQQRHGN